MLEVTIKVLEVVGLCSRSTYRAVVGGSAGLAMA